MKKVFEEPTLECCSVFAEPVMDGPIDGHLGAESFDFANMG